MTSHLRELHPIDHAQLVKAKVGLPTFSMVSRFLEQQQAVCAVLAEDSFTDALTSEKRVTMSALKPIMEHITTEILLDGDEDSDLTKQMKLAMRDDLKTREERASKKTLSGILKHITTTRARQDDNTESGFMPAHSPEQKLRIEINLYMSMPPIEPDADPLDWWKSNYLQLPLLANVAKNFFCVPATNVPSERAFSTSGHILSPQRSRLSVEKINMLSFLHDNLS
ncbi:hypothetical protein SKAU_G00022800 [Synaphobranchus kaupii]|uniref:HAT C-terminal dimerisation domain-containing protein n=1 Tax=Synaphobranchus kaupii TaxID=118154 RepID=A0A9Q1GCP1_SYNKA|nr:hypothetical protein SKAU_G00022800 [Synaphobranchus kaupii]